MNDTQIIIYQSDDGKTKIETRLENETLWLNEGQIAEVFQVNRSGINKHINNIFKDGELEEKSNVQSLHISGSDKPVKFYNLEVIIAKENILDYLKEHKEEFKNRFDIIKIGLFGSYAKGEEQKDSDIDILIELESKTTNIYEKKKLLKETLEKEFNRKVDIAREKYLKPLAKNEILKDVKYA